LREEEEDVELSTFLRFSLDDSALDDGEDFVYLTPLTIGVSHISHDGSKMELENVQTLQFQDMKKTARR